MPAFISLKNRTFSRLTVITREGSINRRPAWRCRCTCGNEVIVQATHLRSGHTQSCGCLVRETLAVANTRHGMHKSRVYGIWEGMIQRCTNPNAAGYENYGGRGITVSPEWRDFSNFYADMGDPPIGKTLERVRNNEGYKDDNCVWATRSEQQLNRRR